MRKSGQQNSTILWLVLPTFPICDSFIPELHFMLPRPTVVLDEIISEHLAGNACRLHHLDYRRLERCTQHLYLVAVRWIKSALSAQTHFTLTLPLNLSSGEKWVIGGPGFNLLSMPLRPSKKIALRAK